MSWGFNKVPIYIALRIDLLHLIEVTSRLG